MSNKTPSMYVIIYKSSHMLSFIENVKPKMGLRLFIVCQTHRVQLTTESYDFIKYERSTLKMKVNLCNGKHLLR